MLDVTTNGIDAFVAKVNSSDGSIMWTTWFRGSIISTDVCYALDVDSAGDIYAAGVMRNGNLNGAWAAHLDGAGNVMWSDVQDTPEQESNFFVKAAPDGSHVTVAGYRNNPAEGQNALITRYNSLGGVVWSVEHNVSGVDGKDFSSRLLVDAAGDVFLLGQEEPVLGTTRSYIQKRSGLDGSLVWHEGIENGGTAVDDARGAFFVRDEVVVVGTIDVAGVRQLHIQRRAQSDGTLLQAETRDVLNGQSIYLDTVVREGALYHSEFRAAGSTARPYGVSAAVKLEHFFSRCRGVVFDGLDPVYEGGVLGAGPHRPSRRPVR